MDRVVPKLLEDDPLGRRLAGAIWDLMGFLGRYFISYLKMDVVIVQLLCYYNSASTVI